MKKLISMLILTLVLIITSCSARKQEPIKKHNGCKGYIKSQTK